MNHDLRDLRIFSNTADEELIRRMSEGETAPLGEIFTRYDGMVKSALKRFAPELTTQELEDLSQEVFIRVGELSEQYLEQTRFKAWLYSIAVGKARNWRRKNWVRNRLLKHRRQVEIDTQQSTPSPLDKLEMRQAALRILNLLPKHQQEVLWLFAVEEFSGDEISAILGIPSNTVWTRLYRARKSVVESFDSHLGDLYKGKEVEQ